MAEEEEEDSYFTSNDPPPQLSEETEKVSKFVQFHLNQSRRVVLITVKNKQESAYHKSPFKIKIP